MFGARSRAPRRGGAYSVRFAAIAALLLLLLAWPSSAQAQVGAVTIHKELCDSSGCNLANLTPGVAPGAAVFYKITLSNPTGSAVQLDVRDTLPNGFQLVGYACAATVNASTPVIPSTAQPLVIPNVSIGANASVECKIAGAFTSAVSSVSNAASTANPGSPSDVTVSNQLNNFVNLTGPQPYNLSIAKTVDLSSVDVSTGPKQVVFTITVTNTGNEDLYLGNLLSVEDKLRLMTNSVVLNASYVSSSCAIVAAPSTSPGVSQCLDTNNPFVPQSTLLVGSPAAADFVRWRYATGTLGLLKAQDQIVLTVNVLIAAVPGADCIIAPNSDGLIDNAHIVLTLPSPVPNGPITTLNDNNAADNISANVPVSVTTGASVVNPNCNAPFGPPSPVLKVTKTQITPPQSGGLPWGPNPITYEVEIENISTTGITVSNLNIADWVVEGVQTPPFTATIVSATCPHPTTVPPANAACLAPVLAPPQSLAGNSDTKQLFGALVPGPLPPTATFKFRVIVHYSNPQCDSYPGINPKPIHNVGMVTGWTETSSGNPPVAVTQTVIGAVTTLMAPPPACPLVVSKTLNTTTPAPVQFGSPIQYTVTYTNPDPNPYTMGTLFDGMRLVRSPSSNPTSYALQLQVDYHYACTTSTGVTGFPDFNPADPSGVGIDDVAYVTETQLPQQGVRLIRNLTPVHFPGNSSLTCTLTAKVHPPNPNDPYCSTGVLDNAAVLDASAFYNPNTPWPVTTTPGMWDSVQVPLPRCYDVLVNKMAAPPKWTWQGGPLAWTLTVTNRGPPIAGDVKVTDQLTPPIFPAESTTCTGAGCAAAWSPSPTTNNPSTLNITALPTLGAVTTIFTQAAAPTSVGPGGKFCNDAAAAVTTGGNWYWKNQQITHSNDCINIIATGSLVVTKQVINQTGLAVGGTYTINVNCTNTNPIYNGPNTSVVLAAGASATLQHIPLGNSCTIQENPLPAVPPGTRTCAFPFWQTGYSPASPVVIAGNVTNATVTNRLRCRPVGSLVIKKTTIFPPFAPPAFSTVQFNVNCSPLGPSGAFTVPANGQLVIANVPIASTCSIVELLPPSTVNGCTWKGTPGPILNVNVSVPNGTVTVKVTNKLVCTGRIVVRKKTFVPAGISMPTAITFSVNCIPGGPFTITAPPNGLSAPLTVPAPSVCSVVENVPLAPAGCKWTVVKNPPGTIPVAPGATAIVSFGNTLVCKPGKLTIYKKTQGPAGFPLPASFQFAVNCSPGGPVTTIAVPSNGASAGLSVPTPATCTLTEQVPPAPRGCSWTVTQSPANPVAVGPGAIVNVFAKNKLSCTGQIVVRKKTSVPAGVSMPTAITFNVSCSPGGQSTITAPAIGVSQPLTVPAPSVCSIVENVPLAPAGCSWTVVKNPPGTVTIAPGATALVSFGNSLTCKSGKLTIYKKTSVPPGLPMPASFQFSVNCSPGGPSMNVAVPANGASAGLAVPAPATCAVAEQVPPPPPGCSWNVTQSPANPIAIGPGASVNVFATNKLVCSPPGTLIIDKMTVSPPALPLPPGFVFTVSCTPGGPNTVVNVPANGISTALAVPGGSTCTVVEQAPPAYAGCTWSVSQAPSGSVIVPSGSTVTIGVTNTLVCARSGSPANLVVLKKTDAPPGVQLPASFQFSVGCNPGPTTLASAPANGMSAAVTVAAPTTCAVTEQIPPPPPFCSWAAPLFSPNPVAVSPGTTAVVTVTNQLICTPPSDATLGIQKLFLVNGSKTPVSGSSLPAIWQQSFPIAVTCGTNAPLPGALTGANGYQIALAVPVGTSCTLQETPPAFPNPACYWSPSYPLGQTIVIVPGVNQLVVHNEQVCS